MLKRYRDGVLSQACLSLYWRSVDAGPQVARQLRDRASIRLLTASIALTVMVLGSRNTIRRTPSLGDPPRQAGRPLHLGDGQSAAYVPSSRTPNSALSLVSAHSLSSAGTRYSVLDQSTESRRGRMSTKSCDASRRDGYPVQEARVQG